VPPPPPVVPPPPPALDTLRAGTQLVAGLGVSTVLPDFDFETFSEAGFEWDEEANKWRGPPNAPQNQKGLGVVGAARYTEDPSCEVLSLRYDLKDGRGSHHWHPGMPPPADLLAYLATGGLIEAWNVGFERWVWENVGVPKYGWAPIKPEQYRCAMAKSRAHAGPGKLEIFGDVFDLKVKKDPDGERLLKKFSMPRNPTKPDPRRRIEPLWTQGDAAERLGAYMDELSIRGLTERKVAAMMLAQAKLLHADVEDTLKLDSYNDTDIKTEAEASSITPDLSPTELRYWQDDQAINKRGVQIDLDGIHDCIAIIEQVLGRYGEELQELTGGIKPSEVQQLKDWLAGEGVHLDSLDQEHVEEALTWKTLPPRARRALELRAASGSASVKKVYAMRNSVAADGRLHDLYVFFGARTGRPTGRGPQPTNLPKAGPNNYRCGFRLVNSKETPTAEGGCGKFYGSHTAWCHWCNKVNVWGKSDEREWSPGAMDDALHAISFRSLDMLQLIWGDALLAVAGVLRGLFIAKRGHELVSSDFTAIEGVVIACLAGEQWRIDAYANDEPMYLLSAERMYGTTVAEMKAFAKANGQHHPLRQKGKFGELGLGFGGWTGALRGLGVEGEEDDLKDMVLKWRAASPAIEWLWGGQKRGPADMIRKNAGMQDRADRWDKRTEMFGLEGMAIQAVLQAGVEQRVTRLDGTDSGISYVTRGDALYCRLPSGGLITYHRPRVVQAEKDWRGLSLSFEGWNSNAKYGAQGWQRMDTYSGKLAENVTQAVARGKQMGAIVRCEDAWYPVVMHTYDEIVAELPMGVGSVEQLESLMVRADHWNEGWPIKAAGGWRASRYRKG
jgi:DNA polymerase